MKRSRKGPRLEGGETDRWMEVWEQMVVEMWRIADGVEVLVAGQQELIEGVDGMIDEQKLIGFGLEVFSRKMGEMKKEKGKGKEKGVETEKGTQEMRMGENDGERDGEGDEEARSAPAI